MTAALQVRPADTACVDVRGAGKIYPSRRGEVVALQDVTLRVTRAGGETLDVPVRCRIDTPIEIDYYQHGGILPYVLRQILSNT